MHEDDSDPTWIALQNGTCSGVTAHGFIPFETSWISHIDGNIFQGGCESGLVLSCV